MIVFSDTAAYLPSLLDADAAPDDLAAWARTVTPGSAVVKPLAHLRPEQFTDAGRVDAIAAYEAQIAWLQARQLRLIAALAAELRPADELARSFATEEIACALRLSHTGADLRLELAEQLHRHFPATLAQLERGELTLLHARFLIEHTVNLEPALKTAVEAAVLPTASGQSLAEFKRAVRRATHAVDTRESEQRHAAALEQRAVNVYPGEDGMATLSAYLPADGARAVMDRLTAMAQDASDARTADQRRADALVELACTLVDGMPPMQPTIQVTVPLSTLLGVDDQPAELAGHGPIPAALARRLADDPSGTWRRLVTDEVGRLVAVGRRSYRPPSAMRRYVLGRDRGCRFPHCNQPAARTEVDHVRDWDLGGATEPANLQALCRRHHHAKHDGGWRVTRAATGAAVWTSPIGKRYVKAPARYPTGSDSDPPSH